MELTLEDLVDLAEGVAVLQNDGHLTIMRFTTHWKVMGGTPNLDCDAGREEVWALKGYPTLKDALVAKIKSYTQERIK